ncbi:MAG: serine hydrolase domain-containing protein [Gemmatimonadota bacterium]
MRYANQSVLMGVIAAVVFGACATTARVGAEKPGDMQGPLAPDRASRGLEDSALVAVVDSFTRAFAAADSFSGVVMLARDDDTLYSFANGFADRASGTRNGPNTRFNLASNDKYFTRIAIRQLQQAGKLTLADLVGTHLPDYPNARVRNEVTIKHLLDGRSGLRGFDSDDDRKYRANRMKLRSIDDYLALFATDSLHSTPGATYAYSNAGYVVLGKIIEAASGQSYYDYVRRHIFEPAGMASTGYYAVDEVVANMAVPYTTSAKAMGNFAAGAKLPERQSATPLLAYRGSSAGGGYSTAHDLLRLARAITSHRLLDAAHTDSLLGFSAQKPGYFEWDGWTGGSEGMNTVYYLHSTGHVIIVLSNYDPPSATVYRRMLWNEWFPKILGLKFPA